MRCLSFFGHPCLCLQIPSFQGLGGIFTRWILAMPGTLRSFSPPSVAAFLRYRLSTLFGRRVYDSPSRSKPPACFFRAAFVRFRRHPWRLFLAIARHSLREASLRLPLQKPSRSKPPACLLLEGRLRSFPPPSMAAIGGSLREASLRLEASLLLASSGPPAFASAAIHAAFLRYRSALSSGGESTTPPPEASLLLASSGPPSFAFAAIHGGFSSLSLSALFGRRVYDSPPPPLYRVAKILA